MHLLKCFSRKQICGVDTVHVHDEKLKSTYIVNEYAM